MLATYASALAVCAASLAIGQAAIRMCGRVRWSWLAPAAGLGLVAALGWATVRLPGDGTGSAAAVAVAGIASALYLRGRVEGLAESVRAGAPVAVAALLAASLPFLVEGRFGILGTSFNPDMSQHLLTASRLGDGADSQLLAQGYPLGPHAIVVALEKGLGAGIVQGFSGLTVAVAVLASLTALALFESLGLLRRTVASLLVGLPYMVASYFAQGAFKETMLALFVLAFAIGLRELSGRREAGHASPPPSLAAVPLALIAAGSVYVYSFPALAWLGGGLALWAALELALAGDRAAAVARGALKPAALALLVFAVLAAPEIGRMADFREFETFDPSGPGLGNLFGQISPFEALGIWPSGDFRLTPGDGAVPAAGYYLGVAFAAALLLHGLAWCARRRETALPAALLAAAAIWLAARVTGTPYQAAKAVEAMAALAAAVIVLPLSGAWDRALRRPAVLPGAAAAAFAAAALGCSLLAFANAPIGPASYSPELTGLRPLIARDSVFVVADRELLASEHGLPYLAWELRGGRVCIDSADRAGGPPPRGVRFVIGMGPEAPFTGLERRRDAGPWVLWRVPGRVAANSDCPLIAVRAARRGEPRE